MADPTDPPAAPTPGAALQELARKESEQVRRARSLRADFARRGEVLATEVPARFFTLAEGLRTAVARFNDSLTDPEPGLRLRYSESPGVVLRDAALSGEMLASVSRGQNRFDLVLRHLSRTGRPDLPIIEGHGSYRKGERTMLRIEGWVEGDKTTFWVSLDFKRMPIDLGELPERIVMSVVKHDPELLRRAPAPAP